MNFAGRGGNPQTNLRGRLGAIALLCGLVCVFGTRTQAEEPFPKDLVEWVPSAVNPVFEARGPGLWDARIRERGWILREGDAWHLWYTGFENSRESLKKLGYATSADGLTWKRAGEPLYDQHWVEDMMVVKQGDTYYMFAEGLNDQAQLLTSTDRVHWTRSGTLDIRYKKDGSPLTPGPFGTPVGWYENDTWHLFYERRDAGVWLATSKDLKVWTNVQDEPVMVPGPDEYDRDYIAFNQIVKRGKTYYAYYHGAAKTSAPSLWTTNIASSEDLLHWKKFSGNPLMLDNKSSGILVNAGTPQFPQLRLYTMHDKVLVHYPAGYREATKQQADGRIVFDAHAFPATFDFTRPGTYSLAVIHAGEKSAQIDLQFPEQKEPSGAIGLAATGSETRYVTQVVRVVRIPKSGVQPLTLKLPENLEGHRLQAIVLTPSREGEPIKQADDGLVTCHARDVTIHGVKVQYEPKPEKNTVGYWINVSDWVSWEFSLTKPGEYEVEVLQGCGKGQGGSTVDVLLAGQTLQFTVEDTGHFQNFVPRKIGKVTLAATGDYSISVKPTRKAKDAVMDIRQLRLIPLKP